MYGFRYGYHARQRGMRGWGPVKLLFANGEGGAAYAFPDMSSWSQDAAGTVPVTAVGQQVCRVADISGRSNNLLQATANFRPRAARAPAGGVRNLLTYTEDLTNSIWLNKGVTVSKEGMWSKIAPESGSAQVYVNQIKPVVIDVLHTLSFVCKYDSIRYLQARIGTQPNRYVMANIDLLAGTITNSAGNGISASITPYEDGYKITITGYLSTGALYLAPGFIPSIDPLPYGFATTAVGDGVSGVLIRDVQLELGNAATTYQKVTEPWDVTEEGKRDCYCLYGDGVDDTMATAGNVFPVRNGMSLVSALAIAGLGPTAGNTPVFGANLSTTGFTISARRSAATVRQLSGFVRNAAGAYTWTTNLGNAGFDFGRPVVAAVTQADDVMSMWSRNPTSDRVASAPLGSTVSAAVPIGVFQTANNGAVRWYGGIIIDRPLTDLERAFVMDEFSYLSGAIE